VRRSPNGKPDGPIPLVDHASLPGMSIKQTVLRIRVWACKCERYSYEWISRQAPREGGP
jgi:hypothetical protein